MPRRPKLTDAERYTFFISKELREGLDKLTERDGISESEAIRRAIQEFLEKKGIPVKVRKTR